MGWFSGSLGKRYQGFHIRNVARRYKEPGQRIWRRLFCRARISSGWTPFVRYTLATDTGSSLKEVEAFGLTQVHPFGRHGDMFGAAFNYSEPSAGKHHESVFESFYRLRLTQSIDLGPDVEVSIHPTYATKAYTTTLLSARMRIIFLIDVPFANAFIVDISLYRSPKSSPMSERLPDILGPGSADDEDARMWPQRSRSLSLAQSRLLPAHSGALIGISFNCSGVYVSDRARSCLELSVWALRSPKSKQVLV